MTANPHTAPAGISVDEFIRDYLLGDRHSSYPVERSDGTICGLITLGQLRHFSPVERASTLVADAAIPLAQVPVAGPDEPVTVLAERLDSSADTVSWLCETAIMWWVSSPPAISRGLSMCGEWSYQSRSRDRELVPVQEHCPQSCWFFGLR
jgi:hypothetical protein